MSPIERPLTNILSPVFPNTNDAVTSLIVNSSSAALAHIKFAFLSSFSYIDTAIVSFIIYAFFTISAI